MTQPAARAGRSRKGTASSFQPDATDREIVWRSGSGRVLRQHDQVKIDGLRGRWRIVGRQPFLPDAVAVREANSASMRYITPDRIHVRRKATDAEHAAVALDEVVTS